MPVERLEKQEIFEVLRPEQVNKLSKASQVKNFKAGEFVYNSGAKADFFYIVLKGEVSLKLPKQEGTIDDLAVGSVFGGCVSLDMTHYNLDAKCKTDTEVLQIETAALKKLMDDDPRNGYLIQSRVSEIYFKRYIKTTKKL
ncbi:Crp/Fnr family transcriptional regulator [Elusimicrobiota bacterium]